MAVKAKSKWPQRGIGRVTTFGGLTRSNLMSRVRSHGNKTTELIMIKLLRSNHLAGWRRNYPLLGSPDFIWQYNKLVLFVDGCFWHGHNCRNLSPKNNAKAWEIKINKNRKRDKAVSTRLRRAGWSVLRVWECQLEKSPESILNRIKRKLAT